MIILWLVLAVIGVFAFVFVKIEHHARLIKMGILVFVIIMIYISMSSMFSSEAVDTSTPQGIINGVYLYIGWLGETVAELWTVGVDTTTTVGNVIKVAEEIKEEFPETNFSIRDKIADIIRKD